MLPIMYHRTARMALPAMRKGLLLPTRSLSLPQRSCPPFDSAFAVDWSQPISMAVAPIYTPKTPTKELAAVAPTATTNDRMAISVLLNIT